MPLGPELESPEPPLLVLPFPTLPPPPLSESPPKVEWLLEQAAASQAKGSATPKANDKRMSNLL
jgi:hypothetical protein